MNLIDKIKTQFDEKMSKEPSVIEVPEWDEKIYYRPMTGKQRDAIMKLVAENKYFEASVEALIQRARTEDGKRVFSQGHKPILMNQGDSTVIERVAEEMGTWEQQLSEDDVKNS